MTSEPEEPGKKIAILGTPGVTDIWITAKIMPALGIQFHAYDSSPDIKDIMGCEEYEYWIFVHSDYSDDLIFSLLKHFASGAKGNGPTIRSFLNDNNIPHLFGNEMWGAGGG